jgi:hypothetical protein
LGPRRAQRAGVSGAKDLLLYFVLSGDPTTHNRTAIVILSGTNYLHPVILSGAAWGPGGRTPAGVSGAKDLLLYFVLSGDPTTHNRTAIVILTQAQRSRKICGCFSSSPMSRSTIRNLALCQGTTSVVPQNAQKSTGLQPLMVNFGVISG